MMRWYPLWCSFFLGTMILGAWANCENCQPDQFDIWKLKRRYYQIMLDQQTTAFFQKRSRCVIAELIPIDRESMYFSFYALPTTTNSTLKIYEGNMYQSPTWSSSGFPCYTMHNDRTQAHNDLLFCIYDMDTDDGSWLIVGDQNQNMVIGLAKRLSAYDDVLWGKLRTVTNMPMVSSSMDGCFFFTPDAVI